MTHKTIDLPKQLCDAIEKYLDTNWSGGAHAPRHGPARAISGPDPSEFGALNAVAYIGERVVALYASTRNDIIRRMRDSLPLGEAYEDVAGPTENVAGPTENIPRSKTRPHRRTPNKTI